MAHAAGEGAAIRIGELAAHVGVRASTVRYWEDEGPLPPPRRAPNGYRLYSTQDLQRARRIRTLRAVGLPTVDIRHIVRACDGRLEVSEHTDDALQRHADQLTARIRDLQRVRQALVALKAAARGR